MSKGRKRKADSGVREGEIKSDKRARVERGRREREGEGESENSKHQEERAEQRSSTLAEKPFSMLVRSR